MTKWIAVLLAALLLAGCGGGDERADGAVAFAGQMRATGVVMATQSAPTAVTADMTLDWAEYNFPDLFPKATGIRFPAVVYEGVTYNARLYAGAWGERYLGITPDGRIFGLGDFTGEALQQFNDIDHWAAQVLADQCNVNPDSCVNLPPVANAGPLQNVTTGTLVTLDGSASSDANGDQLTYSWSLTSKPAGSAAALASATSAKPTFTADLAGTYVASLTVNDGTVNSAAATVTVTAAVANAAPVANAGPAQNVTTGTTVTLNGSGSSDANGDLLTYAWTLTSRPAGSAAALAGATAAAPTFTADVAGTYVASLVVNDGTVNSAAATVTITATVANAAPVANAGPAQNVTAGTTVTLNGSGSSDANGDPLTYAWTLSSKPAGSTALLTGATSAAPTFTADVAGTYVASLVVNDGTVNSAAATVTVTASAANAAPVANAGTAQNVLVGGVVTLNGSASSDANGDPLTYAWTLSSKPAGSTTTLAGATTATPTFTPDIAGSYVAGLTVNDGQVNSARVTVTITATPLPPPIANFFLFGGPGNSVYLGCLTCDQFHAASVCNQFGTYGSQFSASSIWNQFGTYGSQFSSSSPWNQFSTSGPIITGSDTLFYGYFTTNAFQFNRTTVPAFVNVLNFFNSTRDLAATRTYACGS